MPAPQRSRSVELAVAVGVCVAGGMLVYAMLLAEGVGVRDELMLAAPEAARPGETLALRAYLFHDPDNAEGPTPEDGDVDVELRDGARVLATARLHSGAAQSLEGAITVPDDADGTLYLVGRAREGEHLVATVARPLAVADDAPPAGDLERTASPLAHFSLGAPSFEPLPAVTVEGAVLAPGSVPAPMVDTLDAWVVGGVCIPDVPCRVAVDVGTLGVEPQLRDCAGAEPLPPPPVTGVASRYHVLPFVVHGPEGTCELAVVSTSAGSEGQARAHRSIRFPVALATPYLGIETQRAASVPRVALVAPPGREGVVVDVFRDGRWRGTHSLPATGDPAAAATFADLPGGALPPGVYLLQARADALPTAYVAERLVVVGGDAGLAAAHEPPARPGARDAELAFFLASHEQHGLTLPPTASGLGDDRARLEQRKRTARTIAFAGIAVGIVLLVVTVMRRGLSADAEARALMASAGVPGADGTSARRRGRLTVVLMVLALGLALVTGAALVAAHEIALDTASAPS